jgi:predicted  nucleic acid-binding Zn-ribbon protein
MATRDDEQEQRLRAAAEYVERTRRRLADGQATIERLQESVEETNEHLASISGWIDETDRQLKEERERRAGANKPSGKG